MNKTKTGHGIGKRKTSIARATVKKGNGTIRINSQNIKTYQPELARLMIEELITLTGEKINEVNINVNVKGGGVFSRTEAARVAIANALVDYFKNEKLREKYLSYSRQLLVSDIRQKEMNKPYRSAARARRQKSKR